MVDETDKYIKVAQQMSIPRSTVKEAVLLYMYKFDGGLTPHQMIVSFHEHFMLTYTGEPRQLPADLQKFRTDFLHEELDEYKLAVRDGDLEKQFDALIDLVYVACGTAYLQGFEFDRGFRRVHEANMKKVRAQRVEDSVRGSVEFDIVKPAGWVKPDLSDLVKIEPGLTQADRDARVDPGYESG